MGETFNPGVQKCSLAPTTKNLSARTEFAVT